MTRERMHESGAIALLLALMLSAAAGSAVAQSVDERLPAAADGVVEIDLVAGDVAVEGWDRDEVEVTGTYEEGVERVRVERRGRRVEIEVVHKKRSNGSGPDRVGANLKVRVPAGAAVEVDAVSADVEVRGLTGEIEIGVVSGDVLAEVESATLDLETVSGDIEVRAQKARVEVQSVSGDVKVTLAEGDVDAESVSGDVELRIEALGEGESQSVSGDVDFVGGLAPGGSLEVQSHSGNVDISLPAGAAVRIDTDTHSGDVRNDFGSSSLGAGDATVEVSTFSGDIRIRKR